MIKRLTEMNTINASVVKRTNFGMNEMLLQEEHQKVLTQIGLLSDYCKDCKPPKRRKKK